MRFFWAVQPTVRKARSIASSGGPACRSPGIRSQQAPQGHINGFLWASKPAVRQAFARLTGLKPLRPLCNGFLWNVQACAVCKSYPKRLHQWLLLGVQNSRKTLKTLKPLKLSKSVFLERPTRAGNKLPQGQIHRFFWAVQACRSPGLKPLKRLKHRLASRRQQAPQGHINGFLWASKPAFCQALNA